MPHQRLVQKLSADLADFGRAGRLKGAETVFTAVVAPRDGRGPRYRLAGEGERLFLRMNSNSYLGLSMAAEVTAAEEAAIGAYGAGPGAVRFISGTWAPHVELESRLAAFHGREAAMIFSSAYATVMGVLPPLVTPETAIISDELNHNCIINASRLARPKEKHVYAHLDLGELEACLRQAAANCSRAIIVTDGIFSMRGDHAPLAEIMAMAKGFNDSFAEDVVVMVDDSHGVGAFGATGRGTEEVGGGPPVDVLVATLGKAFGVNGGYVAGARVLIDYLRETSPFYVYSNPITPGEAAAAARAVALVDGVGGRGRLAHLRDMTRRFKEGLARLGFESIAGDHPIAPLMVRDTAKTAAIVAFLRDNGVLATGLNYPVVPQGEQEIRFQISADHTAADIDEALDVLARAPR